MEIVRVATFNTRHGAGLDDVVDLKRTAEAITATGADVIGLQELDRNNPRSNREDQPAALERSTGLTLHFDPTVQGKREREYGLAIASRDPLEVDFEPLPQRADEEPRGFQVTRWRGLTVINTHLSTDRAARATQTSALAGFVAAISGPVVVMGDLNQGRWSLRTLTRAGLTPNRKRHHTISTRAVRWEIDFVLAGGGAEVVHSETIVSDASDHVPLVAEVALP